MAMSAVAYFSFPASWEARRTFSNEVLRNAADTVDNGDDIMIACI